MSSSFFITEPSVTALHIKLTFPTLLSHIASALSINCEFSNFRIIIVLPSGNAPMGWMTKMVMVLWAIRDSAAIIATNVTIMMLALPAFIVLPCVESPKVGLMLWLILFLSLCFQ